MKAGKRTKDESGCRWRGRKESHEMLGRFVGPTGESRDRDAVEAGTRNRWTKRGWWEGERRGCNWGGGGLRRNGKGKPGG